MRTTLDLPDPLLRELKIRAAQNGQSLKDLLNELITRALRFPTTGVDESVTQYVLPVLPVLQRLSNLQQSKTRVNAERPTVSTKAAKASDASKPVVIATPAIFTNAELNGVLLQDDIDKLRRSGFIA